jgi:exopolysaccharide/PEP-CTERM locus tyrosine autokinase
LVEQAIARFKKQQGDAKSGSSEGVARPPAHVPAIEADDAAALARRLHVDISVLRASGYLPDQSEERQFTDHYRRIKRPLIEKALSGGAGQLRVIMVASAVPGDGKTFTSINLALSMALERDISVLLVDSDVAKQHLTEILGLRDRKGLLDALIDETLDAESLVVPTNIRGFAILPAGRRAEGTAELLSSSRMSHTIATLCARNPRRILLLDSPPLLITNEGRALVKIAGQVVLVVRAGETPRHAVQAALDLFDPSQAGGLILNQVKVGLTEGYYGYDAYGAYGAYGNKADGS